MPDRVAGWGLAAAASLLAVALLWPAPTRGPLRSAATAACRALAARMRAEVAYMLSDRSESFARDRDHAVAQANGAVAALHRGFLATPYRPTSLSTAARTIVRLVDELNWLNAIVVQSTRPEGAPVNRAACAVKVAAAAVLERGAELLEVTGGNCGALHGALVELTDAMSRMEHSATAELPVRRAPAASSRTPLRSRSASSSRRSIRASARRSSALRSR